MAGEKPNEDGLTEVDLFLQRYPDTRFIDAVLIDMCGIARGKRIPVSELPTLFTQGLSVTASLYALDATGDQLDIMGRGFSDGDPDGTAIPVPGTLAPMPWAGSEHGQVLLHLDEQPGSAEMIDPRNILATVVAAFSARGLTPVVACELEFYLIDRIRTANGHPQPPPLPGTDRRDRLNQVYSFDTLDYFRDFLDRLQEWAEMQAIPTSAASAEFAPAQFEVNLEHQSSALRAADHAALFRRLVKSAAIHNEMEATFHPKPYPEQAGSGFHVHISLLDKAGRNIFAGQGEKGSEALRHAIAGLCAALPETMAICVPNVGGFRRFEPDLFVPLSACWGYNNRSVAVRVPPGPDTARRLEHRVACADANPYLLLAALLAGILYGLDAQLDPGPDITGRRPGSAGSGKLPLTPWDALSALDRATILPRYLPQAYLGFYAEAKRRELEKFIKAPGVREYAWYL
ncbi:MAG TPA: glutamine synthetase [Alphaproteobacteria bacterium]|nr:glutamine synthetase [Alphaproteobacteria bacterium]HBF97727.1 glutamine synthetase [Alphaproteobacteria bacterium]